MMHELQKMWGRDKWAQVLLLVGIVCIGVTFAYASLVPADKNQPGYRISFAGDTYLGERADAILMEKGHGWAIERLPKHDTDLFVYNAEAPLTSLPFPDDPNYHYPPGSNTPRYYVHTSRGKVKRYVTRSHPDAAGALADYGMDVATLSNNHALDLGPAGLSSTISALADVGISSIGAGLTDADAAAPYIAESPHGRVGIFSFGEKGGTAPDATPQSAGIRVLNTANVDAAAAMAREQKIDWLVAVVHWGNNYAPVLPTQQKWAQRLAKRGFHLVVGHGPHVLQPVSLVATKRRGLLGRMTHHTPVLYSLGNFSFQFPGRFTPEFPGYGVVATAVLGPSGFREIQLTCIQTDNRIVNYQIRPCSDDDANRVLDDLWPGIEVIGATGTVRL